MVRISVMYPSGDGKTFDHAYYVDKHMALVRQRWGGRGLVRTEVDRGVAGGAPGALAPYIAVGHVYFNTMQEFQNAVTAHGQELFADVPNFTNIQPQIQISEVIG